MFLRRLRRTAALTVVVATTALVTSSCTAPASPPSNPAADSHVVASVTPLASTPDFQNGAVEAIAQQGNRMIAGGSFTSVAPPGSSVVQTRNYLMAFDPSSGALDSGFQPVVNGEVDAL